MTLAGYKFADVKQENGHLGIRGLLLRLPKNR